MASEYAGTAEFHTMLFDERAYLSMVFLRGHLMVEQALTTIIELQHERAGVVLERATFASKLNLCDGLGLIDSELAQAIRSVNRERNRLAHSLDAIVSIESTVALVERMPTRIRKAIEDVSTIRVAEAKEEVTRRIQALRATGASEEYLAGMEAGFVDGARTTDNLVSLFLVLSLGLGLRIQTLDYEATHSDKVESYKWACAIAEIEGTGATPESIRRTLKLPDPPNPRDALSALFNRDRTRAGGA